MQDWLGHGTLSSAQVGCRFCAPHDYSNCVLYTWRQINSRQLNREVAARKPFIQVTSSSCLYFVRQPYTAILLRHATCSTFEATENLVARRWARNVLTGRLQSNGRKKPCVAHYLRQNKSLVNLTLPLTKHIPSQRHNIAHYFCINTHTLLPLFVCYGAQRVNRCFLLWPTIAAGPAQPWHLLGTYKCLLSFRISLSCHWLQMHTVCTIFYTRKV